MCCHFQFNCTDKCPDYAESTHTKETKDGDKITLCVAEDYLALTYVMLCFIVVKPPVGSTVVKIHLIRFLSGCRKRQLNQVCMSHILPCFSLFCLLGPLYVSLICIGMCSWLLVVLVKLSVLDK